MHKSEEERRIQNPQNFSLILKIELFDFKDWVFRINGKVARPERSEMPKKFAFFTPFSVRNLVFLYICHLGSFKFKTPHKIFKTISKNVSKETKEFKIS